jgi:enterochelin esterase family protein
MRPVTSRFYPATALALTLVVCCASAASSQSLRPNQLGVDPRAPVAAARLRAITIFDSAYHRPRQIWIYTPAGYDARRTAPYPLIVAFDGVEYRDTMPLPLILDTLTAQGVIPSFVGVLIDNGEGGVRIADLGNAARMVQFLGRQLMPYVRGNYHVTTDPHRVIVTGSSAGGLAAAFVAFQRSDLFGNVFSQSGAFWRGAEASNSPPFEWLTAQIAAAPKKDVRFLLDVGELEDYATLGGSGPNFRYASRRFRDALLAKGYAVTYEEIPGGQHGPAYWMTRLPVGIQSLSSTWR